MDWSVIKTEERIEVLLSSYSFDVSLFLFRGKGIKKYFLQ